MSNRHALLDQIFAEDRPHGVAIILQTWDKCIFRADFQQSPSLNRKLPVIVRLECDSENMRARFASTAALQKLAALAIPDLVPQTFQLGRAASADGRIFCLSVTAFVEGSTLEEIWEHLNVQNQEAIVTDLVAALRKLQAIGLHHPVPRQALVTTFRRFGIEESMISNSTLLGGPHTGFVSNGQALLQSILEQWKLKQSFRTV